MADIFSIFGEWGKSLMNNWWIIAIVVIALLLVILVIIIIRDKKVFQYPVRIFRIRENGKCLEANYKGGYIGRKNSAPFFQIKTGKWPWQKINLTTTPNPKYLDEQNRVYYKQIDINTYIQLQRTLGSDIDYSPVECDVKYAAVLDIHRIRNILKTESTLAKIAPYIALILLFIAAIVGWWMVMNAKCPV